MKLVIAEKPSVAMSLAAVLGANEKKGWVPGGKRLSGELVRGAPFGIGPARSLRGTVCQMVICGSADPAGDLEI